MNLKKYIYLLFILYAGCAAYKELKPEPDVSFLENGYIELKDDDDFFELDEGKKYFLEEKGTTFKYEAKDSYKEAQIFYNNAKKGFDVVYRLTGYNNTEKRAEIEAFYKEKELIEKLVEGTLELSKIKIGENSEWGRRFVLHPANRFLNYCPF